MLTDPQSANDWTRDARIMFAALHVGLKDLLQVDEHDSCSSLGPSLREPHTGPVPDETAERGT
ncbi:hypothetical protein ACWGQL_33025 [Streptomyces lydicus]|uniref:hypothetical protein n=1 Tax=Streptomyces lydicus TaxID=47763 RepID=UPI0037D895D2